MAQRDYGHLLASAFGLKGKKGKAAEAEDTTDEHEGEPIPANDKEDGKKGKGAKKSGKKAGEGSEDEEKEDEESEEGEGEESRETTQEDEEDEENEREDKKRGKKGKKASFDRESIIAGERVRIRKILSSEAAQLQPKAAMTLALETSMPAGEAIAFLSIQAENGAGKPKSLRIDERMANAPKPTVGLDVTPGAAVVGKLSVESMQNMSAGDKAKLITASGMIRRGEASNIQEALKQLAS